MKSRLIVSGLLLMTILIGVRFYTNEDGLDESNAHPRLYTSDLSHDKFVNSMMHNDSKNKWVEKKKERLEKYIKLCQEDSTWLVSRLQMNWKTKHDKVYLKGGDFSHSDGEAPVPTVRYSGTRDWATDYKSPSLEEVQPYFDDERGMYFPRRDNGEWEWIEPKESGHIIEGINRKIMGLVEDAAFLYWLTGEEKYATFVEPIFIQYIEGMYYRNPPEVINDSDQAGISGLATFEVIHEKVVVSIALTYDFLHDYFNEKGIDMSHTQAVLQKWGDQILAKGIPENNWNLFQARFLTYIAIVLDKNEAYENGKGREYYLSRTFDISSERQIALNESMLVYDQKNGVWPESPSYSIHVTTTLLEILTLLDHYTGKNELANFPIIEKAAIAAFQYTHPSGHTVGFGDSGHKTLPPKNFELLIANYRQYGNKEKEKVITQLLSEWIENGTYKRKTKGLFELFFYVDELVEIEENGKEVDTLRTPTFYASNTSFFVQRQGKGDDAMMIATMGSFGNHAHANGIAIELYANNYVLSPDMGRGSSYWHPDFLEYYSQFPAHNTVVVDGQSTHKSMRSYNPYTLESSFPKSGQISIFSKASFVNVSFVEPKTMSTQNRLTAIIETPTEQRYAIDVFRSKKIKGGTQKHDYFYHNIGQSLDIFNTQGDNMSLKSTTDFDSKSGDLKAYDYFSDKKKAVSDHDLTALFDIGNNQTPEQKMKLWVKGSKGQQVYSVLGPKSNALSSGTAPEDLLDKKVPALVLRREKPAWNDPFAIVFNPYLEAGNNGVKDVKYGGDGLDAQQIVVELPDNKKDIIWAGASVNSVIKGDNHYQKGLLSIVRNSNDTTESHSFIFGAEITQLKTSDWEIIASGSPVTISVEKQGNSFVIQNDKPVVLRVPVTQKMNISTMEIFDGETVTLSKPGIVSRHNKQQIEFRLERAFDKVILK